jgi:hypothetical protein
LSTNEHVSCFQQFEGEGGLDYLDAVCASDHNPLQHARLEPLSSSPRTRFVLRCHLWRQAYSSNIGGWCMALMRRRMEFHVSHHYLLFEPLISCDFSISPVSYGLSVLVLGGLGCGGNMGLAWSVFLHFAVFRIPTMAFTLPRPRRMRVIDCLLFPSKLCVKERCCDVETQGLGRCELDRLQRNVRGVIIINSRSARALLTAVAFLCHHGCLGV